MLGVGVGVGPAGCQPEVRWQESIPGPALTWAGG